jgi:glycosyltransferase involved in cell wall biosynthesis
MRILVTQESDWLTRGPHQQHQIFDRLSERGHEIRVIDYDIDWNKKGIGWWQGRQVFPMVHKVKDNAKILVIRPGMIRLPVLNFISTWFANLFEIKRQVKEFKPDVIVGLGILNADLSVLLKGKIPFVYYWLDILHTLIPLKAMRWIGKILEGETLMYSDKVVVINQSMRDYVLRHSAERVTVIGAGVDLKTFKPSNLKIREQYGVKPNETLLFFMGYVYPFSGLDIIARQLKDYPKFKLMVVGDGESFGELNRIRDELQLGDRIITIDKKPYKDIPDYINAADVCILPAEVNETMRYIVPIKIYEYMALGKPIISTRLPGVMEEFGHGNGIVYVDKAEHVLKMAKDIKLDYHELGCQSLDYVKNCDWDILADKFEKLLLSS